MAKARSGNPNRPTFTLDPYNDPLPPLNPPDPPKEETRSIQTARSISSPFSTADDPEPPSEMCIIAFPVQTYKAVSDEAQRRGLTFSQAVSQAFDGWFAKLK